MLAETAKVLQSDSMPLVYTRDETRLRIFASSDGVITVDDILSFIEAQHAEGAWRYSVLVDARAAHTNLVPEDIRRIMARVEELSSDGKGDRWQLLLLTRLSSE